MKRMSLNRVKQELEGGGEIEERHQDGACFLYVPDLPERRYEIDPNILEELLALNVLKSREIANASYYRMKPPLMHNKKGDSCHHEKSKT